MTEYESFAIDATWLPYGQGDTGQLVRLMRSRRSCRNFREKPVSAELLSDLIKVGVTAPSGSNCQPWTFALLPDRSQVEAYARHIARFFEKLNRTAEMGWLRQLLRLCGRPALDDYYRSHYQTIERGLEAWRSGGRDRLFHGASAVIVVAARKDASCPAEDALLATQNILLAAHTMGLGTCLIGFAVAAMNKEGRIAAALEIPPEEQTYAVIALGWPKKVEAYHNLCGRLRANVRRPDLTSVD